MRSLFVSLFLFYAFSVAAGDHIDSIRARLLDPNDTTIFVTAHRGDWRGHPENSLEAIVSAADMGVDIVEVDIQRTKDGHFILMHDKRLNRTTTGRGLVADTTLAYIRTLCLKRGINTPTRLRVPTLEEALMAAKGRVMLNLDKADRFFPEIYPLLVRTGTLRQIIFKGKDNPDDVRRRFGPRLRDIIYMPVINIDETGDRARRLAEAFLADLHPAAIEFVFKDDTCSLPSLLPRLLKGKSRIWYNALWSTMAGGHDDDISLHGPDLGYGYLIDHLGAGIIQTDRPQYLINYLRRRHLHD